MEARYKRRLSGYTSGLARPELCTELRGWSYRTLQSPLFAMAPDARLRGVTTAIGAGVPVGEVSPVLQTGGA
jgi:hypothetical protein